MTGLRRPRRPIPASPAPEPGARRLASIAVCSAKHSPGATTLSLALAAAPPAAGSVLVDADADGGDLAVLLGGSSSTGLAALLGKAHRGLTERAVSEQCQLLALGPALVAAPVDREEARTALTAVARQMGALLPSLASRAVFDCGRLSADSPSLALADAADVLVWVMNHTQAGLEHTRRRLETLPGLAGKSVAVLSGRPGRQCDPSEREDRLGIPVAGTIAFDRRGVELLLTGSRRWERTTLGASARNLLGRLQAEAAREAPASQAAAR